MDGTKIEWTDATWNPIRGCTRISEGCRNLEIHSRNHNKRLDGRAIFPDGQVMAWAWKKQAGRELDGTTWDQYPERTA